MRLLTPLAATAALLFAAPALAQDAPIATQATAPQAVAPAKSAEELALEADAEAFSARMQAMGVEIQAAVQGSGGDRAKADTDVNTILGRYEPEIGVFADKVEAFLTAQSVAATEDAEKQGYAAASAQAGANIRGIPTQVRTQVGEAFARAAAAPAAAPAAQ